VRVFVGLSAAAGGGMDRGYRGGRSGRVRQVASAVGAVAGVADALARPMLVVEPLELAGACSRCARFQIKVRSSSSSRQACTHRSMIEFIRGSRIPLGTTSIPASASTVSNRSGHVPFRSRIMNRARVPASCRFRAACVTQEAVGWAVAPRILMRRVACSITANTYSRAPDRVTVSKKSHASSASAWERRNAA
jgi:hypothetical protein